MQIVFSHMNFPAQFGSFGTYLATQGWEVSFFTEKEGVTPPAGCRIFRMKPHRSPTEGVHRFARPLEKAVINGQAFASTAIAARQAGLTPDIVVAHSGWGAGTFAKAVWPDCRYVSYVEWYYRYPPVDMPDIETGQNDVDGRALALTRNAPTLLDMAEADMVLCPTYFQAAQFPDDLRQRLTILHDGVDTRFFVPDPQASFPEPVGALPDGAEVITYATRGMEPHRGFPEFMRAVAKLQKRRSTLHAVIGGADRVAYGTRLGEGRSWKQIMLDELELDTSRLHWTGLLPRKSWRQLMQASHVHVYLTVPFVLSWSVIEAMAAGCAIVASDSRPVREAITPGQSGVLVDHKDIDALAGAIERLLDDRAEAAQLGHAAREAAIRDFDSGWIYPAKARLLADLVKYGRG
ncbi:Glycosyl transferase, group 1 [Rhodovulum sp. P5]|uniref:glycosyltransferase n=1 Tax=Rhodovulum sp. P5 TaxID=1564506 RepID=UPI0009C30517|nr:glycosyltransferase [Rhodovulum sp. P5]ARE41125.1 Glycosyl transferase, group 1 [Rhodovulum sp. P5]